MLKVVASPNEQIVLQTRDGPVIIHVDLETRREVTRASVSIDAPKSVEIEREPRQQLRSSGQRPEASSSAMLEPAKFQIGEGYELVMFGANGQRNVLGTFHTPAPSRYTVHTYDGDVSIRAMRQGTRYKVFRVVAPTTARLVRWRVQEED